MIKAHAGSLGYGYSVGIYVVNEETSTRHLLRYTGSQAAWEEVSRDGRVTEPTFVMEDSAARALLDALMRYYQGAEDTRALRKDYDAERARADKLTTALIDNHAIAVKGITGAIAR
jgi:hypothetical protein